MKLKNYLASSLLSLLALTSACTSEELIAPTPGGNTTEQLPEGAVQFKIDGINSGAVESRAVGGNVIANAQENRVDNLTILVFGSEDPNASDDELTFRDYWTSEKRTDFICDKEKKTFSLKGMGKYYTATIVVPAELEQTFFLFLTNQPRVYDATEFFTIGASLKEFKDFYKAGDEHLHTGHLLQKDGVGMTFGEAIPPLLLTEAIDGVGVPTGYTSTVPDLTNPEIPFEMENNYFGFITGQRETLAMTGIYTTTDVTVDGQSMGVSLHRNVARLDVSVDGGIELEELKLTNISALVGNIWESDDLAGVFYKKLPDPVVDPTEVQSTFSLMRLTEEAQPKLVVPARSYCYPSVAGLDVKLIGELTDGTTFTIPFVDKDTKEQLEVKNNHRYRIHLRRTADNHIDANIIVEDWKVGEEIEVDLNDGDDKTPMPVLAADANNALSTWQGTSKVTCMVSDKYSFENPGTATYPWLYFSLDQMSSLGLRMYYLDQEVDFPGALFDPKMEVHKTTESADGTRVAHEVMVTQPTVSTQWLKLQNNFDPTKKHVIKVETGNLEHMGINAKTPALIAFAETNVDGGALIAFPQGGFDGPYATPVADWSTLRGTANTDGTFTVTGYTLPTAQQLQCIAPDKGWGRFTDYNGANVVKTIIDQDVQVLYSGSPLDRNIIKVVVDRKQTGDDLPGISQPYVNIEATLWHLDLSGHLRINVVNFAIPGTDAGRLTSYSALTDLFNNKQNVSAGYTRYFPAADAAPTAYWGEGGCALMFNDNTVWFNPAYTGDGMVRPVMVNGDGVTTMKLPVREPVVVKERVIQDIITIGEFKAMTSNGKAITWTDAVDNAPKGYVVPTYEMMDAMLMIDEHAIDGLFPYVAPTTKTGGEVATPEPTLYWLGDADNNGNAIVVSIAANPNGNRVLPMPKATTNARVVYVKDSRAPILMNGRPVYRYDLNRQVASAVAEGEDEFAAGAWTAFNTAATTEWQLPTLRQIESLGYTSFNGVGEYTIDMPPFFFPAFPTGKKYWLKDEVTDSQGQAQTDKAYVMETDETNSKITISIEDNTATGITARFVKDTTPEIN